MFIPLYIDVRGWRILVFGGGSVGYRRARLFLEAGAKEVVIASMDFSDVVKELASKDPRVKLVRLKVPEDLEVLRGLVRESNLVVVASSDPEANKVVARLSLEAGKLVNNATDARRGNVIVPFKATLYGGIHVAVTSLGEAGVAARRVLERIVETLARDVELETLYKVMSKVKRRLKREIKDPKARIKLYFAIANDELFRELVKKGDPRSAYERALELARIRRYP